MEEKVKQFIAANFKNEDVWVNSYKSRPNYFKITVKKTGLNVLVYYDAQLDTVQFKFPKRNYGRTFN